MFSSLYRRGRVGYYSELNLGIPPNVFMHWISPGIGNRNVHGWLLLQYLSGYGETLLEYNQRISRQLRVGVMLVP